MEKELAVSILSSRSLVTTSGKKEGVKVENVSFKEKETALGRNQVAIVNLSAMTRYQVAKAKSLFTQGEFQEATNQRMSFGVLEGDYVPTKGELVDIQVIEKDNKDGIASLFISKIIPMKAEKLSKVNFSFDEEEGTEIAEEIPAFSAATRKVVEKV
jgi:hypothetical protein